MHILRRTSTTKIAAAASVAALALAVYLARTPEANACGCFAPPDPSVPIVQAGESIVFSMEDGVVTAHIQIQYSGDADEFAWLVPLPSEPELELGVDELFAQVISTTQPKYRVNREFYGGCEFGNNFPGGAGPSSDGSEGGFDDQDPDSPLVLRETVGPYDAAVLRADSKQPMLDWLAENEYFVPVGTDDVVDPYIRPGAFFLALKLRKGESTGDLQPVVVKYESERPMIPIILTSVAADPDMGILVWVLGDERAIPVNYYHTEINDAAIDWLNFGQNYVDVVTRAVNDANRGQSFVTEYAGDTAIMRDILDYSWRFGDLGQLAQITDAVEYVNYLLSNGYGINTNQPPFGIQFSTQLLSLLQRELPVPTGLAAEGVTPNDYYTNMSWYINYYQQERPDLFTDLDLEFDPALLTADITERIVEPTLAAGQLFRDNKYMTRMFTTLSPDEMTRDPVFSFNPDLPDYSNIHTATLRYFCNLWNTDAQLQTPAELITEQGWNLNLPDGESGYDWPQREMPASRYTQIAREEGPFETVLDNDQAIDDATGSKDGGVLGCSVSGSDRGELTGLFLLGLGLALILRRRRA